MTRDLSLLENVPCSLEKNVYSAFEWTVLKILMRSDSPNVSLKLVFPYQFSVLMICPLVSGVLKAPTTYCATVNLFFYAR